MTKQPTMTSQSLRSVTKFGKGMGYVPDLADFRDDYLHFAVAHLPKTIDLTSKCPAEVYDQGELGSCTGNSIAGAIQFERMKQAIADADKHTPSRLFIYWNERVIEHTESEDSGAMIRDGIKSVANLGVCFEDGDNSWPYDVNQFANKPPQGCFDAALHDQCVKYKRVYQTLSSMRGCLAKGMPFVIGFSVYESFESQEVANTGVVEMPKDHESMIGGHAVLTVGYDDASRRFIVRNSWGKDWGKGGYFTVPYEYWSNNDLASDIWNIQLMEPGS